ncbi:hypothetical protein F5Y18DRAFT_444339 [Xylariaceae sp. FL1019]|nr:hypothetical protein F5Y18DRAFT_444339 [Xylariaceae sp. FL1019]
MKNFCQDMRSALPTISEDLVFRGAGARPSHTSLPKLKIHPHRGPTPEEVPENMIEYFLEFVAVHRRPPVLIPLPVVPTTPSRDFNSPSPEVISPSGHTHIHPRHHPDPYVTDLPTPCSLLFTACESEELAQRQSIVGTLQQEHFRCIQRFEDNLGDPEVRKELQAHKRKRQENIDGIAKILERRKIRRQFRVDFNHGIYPGW